MEFFENQKNFHAEKLMEYAGQHIAWRWDGSRILAAPPDEKGLYEKLHAAGIDTQRVVLDYVDPPDVTTIF